MPVASIIIPTHDRAATLPLAVRSALAQSEPDIEVLIVGDGCTPAVRDVARGLAASDLRVRFLDQPKAAYRGAANRDLAVRAARAPLIFYNDDDDLLLPHHVATLAPYLVQFDVIDTPVASVRPDGAVDLGLHNSADAVQRRLLAEGRLKMVFDTHLAHRRDAYLALGKPWSAAAADEKPVGTFLQTLATATDVRWATLHRITALSFHGARRATMADAARIEELAGWAARIDDPALERDLREAGRYHFHISNLTWALSRADQTADWQEAFVRNMLRVATASRAAVEFEFARANIALSLRRRRDVAATAPVAADLLDARYGPIFPTRTAMSKLRPAFSLAEIAKMLDLAPPQAPAAALARLFLAVHTNQAWEAANDAAHALAPALPSEDAFGFAAEAMGIVAERDLDAARRWADIASARTPEDYADPFLAEREKLALG